MLNTLLLLQQIVRSRPLGKEYNVYVTDEYHKTSLMLHIRNHKKKFLDLIEDYEHFYVRFMVQLQVAILVLVSISLT